MALLNIENKGYLGVSYTVVGTAIFFAILVASIFVYPPLLVAILTWIFIASPFWAPVILFGMWWGFWRRYVRAQFIAKQKPVLLEIKVPRQLFKTPRAMELFFAAMAVGPGESNFIARWIDGKVRPWWSFEIVSMEGKIHFYIWTWDSYREYVETQLYAQYPNLEIHEVEDYTAGMHYNPRTNNVWGMEYALNKSDAYPIQTYIDFQLDQETRKPEQIIDPLSGIFEKLSNFGPGEQLWVQIVIRQNKGPRIRPLFSFIKTPKWKEEVKAEIEKIYEKSKPETKDLITGEVTEGYPLLKPAEVTTIKALERSLDKPAFDTGIRAIYITKKDAFHGNLIATHIVGLFNAFNSGTLNGFQPADFWHVGPNYPWEDFMGIRDRGFSHGIIDAYKRRSMFHAPYNHPRFVMTSEELATLYHFPSEEMQAPGIERISSTKGEPPSNLPT